MAASRAASRGESVAAEWPKAEIGPWPHHLGAPQPAPGHQRGDRMAGAIERRQQIWQQQHDQQNQQKNSDHAQIKMLPVRAARPRGPMNKPVSADISMIITGFSSPFKAFPTGQRN